MNRIAELLAETLTSAERGVLSNIAHSKLQHDAETIAKLKSLRLICDADTPALYTLTSLGGEVAYIVRVKLAA